MKIRLTEAIRHASTEYSAGALPDLPEAEARALIAAGHAEAVSETDPSTTHPATTKRSK
nr:MAG TPA: hypothetical protein [Caudoviricetes sp.]